MEHWKPLLINETSTVREAMQQIGRVGERILFVVDKDQKLIGTLTDGDIRRHVLAKGELSSDISGVFNPHPTTIQETYNKKEVQKLMLRERLPGIPVVNDQNVICDAILWGQIFDKVEERLMGKIPYPVVIMAGGKGSRLDPFTKILPKPLVPIGEKTILELIMDRFEQYDVQQFYLSINHKSQLIKAYLDEIQLNGTIQYIEEEQPLGTAGSLKFLEGKIKDSVIVSNCDIIIEVDYMEIVDFHESHGNDITIVGSFRHFTIPYGVCHIQNGGDLVSIEEKPEFDYLVNTGMYIVKESVLKYIPENTFYNFTDLITRVKDKGGKVGVFPVDSKAWIDIGQWEEYRKSLRQFEKKIQEI